MSNNTTNLGLFKYETIADAKEEFNIDMALNANWDKIDEAIGKGGSFQIIYYEGN